MYGTNEIVGKRGRIIGIVPMVNEGIAVIAVEAVKGTEPHEASAVLMNGVNRVVRQAVADVEPGPLLRRLG